MNADHLPTSDARFTSSLRARNWGRGLLAMQAMQAGGVAIGGLSMWLAPLEGCQRWAALRGIELAAIECPRYNGEHAALELYNFSLSKHHTMLGVLFAYLAVYGRSRLVINLGFAYFAVAMALDSVPVFSWLSAMVEAPLPPIGRAGLVFVAIGALGIYLNSRHSQWSATRAA